MPLFHDRRDAGRRLARRLEHLRAERPVVVGLPRGGVPVAAEVAAALGVPLDVIVVRKLGVPFQPELGMGAVGEGGVRVLNDDIVALARVSTGDIEQVAARERGEVERRARLFREGHEAMPLAGRTVIVVDDGIATGGTARAALQVARAHGARRVVLAVPVAPGDTLADLSRDADEIVCLSIPEDMMAVGLWYENFTQTTDEEVRAALAAGVARVGADPRNDPPGDPVPASAADGDPPGQDDRPDTPMLVDEDVAFPADAAVLAASLAIPAGAVGVVVFAHGTGSSRHSPRNRFVARALQRAGLATLLLDLLTPAEEVDRANVFDIELLAPRLAAATDWLATSPEAGRLPVGYFGASTGAAAALWAASAPESRVRAVVSRGGRPDLAGHALADVRVPTLLIVGGHDEIVLELNREAAARMRCHREIIVVPGATHLFEEPGALETVADLAAEWFLRYLRDTATA